MPGRLLLLRAFLDTGSLRRSSGYYSPLHGSCATLIPVPETKARAEHLEPSRAVDPCTSRPLVEYMPLEGGWTLHWDPRLDLGFYTDYYAPRGRLPHRPGHRLNQGDVLAFMAGLAVYPEGFWERRRRKNDILRAFRRSVSEGRAGIYLVGLIRIRAVIDVSRTGWNHALTLHPQLRLSPHYHRPVDEPVAVIGEGYLVEPPAPLSKPNGALARQPPSPLLEQLIGSAAAKAVARGNYRRSRVVRVGFNRLQSLLEEKGYRLVPAPPPPPPPSPSSSPAGV